MRTIILWLSDRFLYFYRKRDDWMNVKMRITTYWLSVRTKQPEQKDEVKRRKWPPVRSWGPAAPRLAVWDDAISCVLQLSSMDQCFSFAYHETKFVNPGVLQYFMNISNPCFSFESYREQIQMFRFMCHKTKFWRNAKFGQKTFFDNREPHS